MTTVIPAPVGSATALAPLDDAGRAALFTDARTANTFASTPVSDEELSSIWELAKWAPTAGNTQPLRVLFIRSEAGRARLAPHMDEGNRAKTISAPAIAVLAQDTQFHQHIPVLLPFKPELKDVFEGNEAARLQAATFNSTLQTGYFILAVRAHGLAAGPMAGFNSSALDEEFFAGSSLKSLLVVNIGHPGDNPWFDRLPRLSHDDVISWA